MDIKDINRASSSHNKLNYASLVEGEELFVKGSYDWKKYGTDEIIGASYLIRGSDLGEDGESFYVNVEGKAAITPDQIKSADKKIYVSFDTLVLNQRVSKTGRIEFVGYAKAIKPVDDKSIDFG
ncbi:hypothetical protein [Hungatella hathewayi]